MFLPVLGQCSLNDVGGVATLLRATGARELLPLDDPELLTIVKPATTQGMFTGLNNCFINQLIDFDWVVT